ncbi:serine/threonine-protein kinase [Nannocystis pusilla]|uniref:serine/threonine-protein kinase n=1 Tax=Nannocystis pusilla TaxID=889268 RepID=UPI003B789907
MEAHASRCEACRQLLSELASDATPTHDPGAPTRTPAADPADPAELDLPLQPGARLGRYVVMSLLGAGGMGVVYAAHDPELGRPVALKLLRPHPAGPRRELEDRLRREAQAMARLSHPNVAAVHDVGQIGGRIFIAMELIRGQTLAAWLRAAPRARRDVLARFLLAGRGLAAAHAAGLVHRDFKPENVLVGDDGQVRVVDFGLARASGDEPLSITAQSGPGSEQLADLTATGAVLGTPIYMAPEQHEGRPAEARSDQFSFCVALYTALYGQRPFAGDTVESLALAVRDGRLSPRPAAHACPGACDGPCCAVWRSRRPTASRPWTPCWPPSRASPGVASARPPCSWAPARWRPASCTPRPPSPRCAAAPRATSRASGTASAASR